MSLSLFHLLTAISQEFLAVELGTAGASLHSIAVNPTGCRGRTPVYLAHTIQKDGPFTLGAGRHHIVRGDRRRQFFPWLPGLFATSQWW